jgi:hypothetical protein
MGSTQKGKISNATNHEVWFAIKNSFIQLKTLDSQSSRSFGLNGGINSGGKTNTSD